MPLSSITPERCHSNHQLQQGLATARCKQNGDLYATLKYGIFARLDDDGKVAGFALHIPRHLCLRYYVASPPCKSNQIWPTIRLLHPTFFVVHIAHSLTQTRTLPHYNPKINANLGYLQHLLLNIAKGLVRLVINTPSFEWEARLLPINSIHIRAHPAPLVEEMGGWVRGEGGRGAERSAWAEARRRVDDPE